MSRSQAVSGVRGMRALPPDEAAPLRRLESTLIRCAEACGYDEIALPLLERTELFTRSIGETTDIVGKEMYSFVGRDGESLSLRPEGTASCVRFIIEKNLAARRPARFWYSGPMFRYERPQKGRSRQFFQFGAEAVGMPGTDIEAELLLLNMRIWRQLGVDSRLELEIASLGNDSSRSNYRQALVEFLQDHRDQLDEHSQERLQTNPLRILDSKAEETRRLLQSAPLLPDYLDQQSTERFAQLRTTLDTFGLAYRINPFLVRGLDYYCHTVFEWVAKEGLGAQSTVCAGGRYDGLAPLLGGEAIPATGFALGLDRLLLLPEPVKSSVETENLQFFIAIPGDGARHSHLKIAENLRNVAADIRVVTYLGNASLKAQMKQAHAAGADYVVLAGEKELTQGQIRARRMRDGNEELFAVDDPGALLMWATKGEVT